MFNTRNKKHNPSKIYIKNKSMELEKSLSIFIETIEPKCSTAIILSRIFEKLVKNEGWLQNEPNILRTRKQKRIAVILYCSDYFTLHFEEVEPLLSYF